MKERLIKLLVSRTKLKEGQITEETKLVSDLGIDSLDLVYLISDIEEEFNLDLEEDDSVYEIETVGDLLKKLSEYLS